MSAIGLVLAWFYVPKDTIAPIQVGLRSRPKKECLRTIASSFNPMVVFKMFLFPNILLAVCHHHSKPS